MEFLSKEILLGLTVQEFLLHLFNFAILVAALYFLLYKPVRKFMKKREETYKTAESNYLNAIKEVDKAKENGEKLITDARDEAVKITEQAHALAMTQTDEILQNARDEAKDIIRKANDESKSADKKIKEEMYYSITNLAVDISQKLLDREFTEKDNDKFIDDIINDLEKKDEEEHDA